MKSKICLDDLNKLLKEKWKVRFDDYEEIEPYLEIIENDDSFVEKLLREKREKEAQQCNHI
jgi:predicted nucleic acid-binding OB-fold protein